MATEPTLTTPTEGSANAFAVHKKVEMDQQKTWLFGSVSADETVPTCYPVGFNSTTGFAAKWMAPDPTVAVVDGGFTGGTWGLTVNGIAIAKTVLAWNATAALVAATIKASTGVEASVDLTGGAYTITFDGEAEITTLPTVTVDVTSLTGGTPAATVTAGTASYGTHNIKGIVWPEPIDLSATGEKHGVCMVFGNVDFEELEAVVDSGDVAALTTACQSDLLPRGLNVQNLEQVR